MKSLRPAFEPALKWAKDSYRHLSGKGVTHWLIVTILVLSGILIGEFISEHKLLIGPRHWVYKWMQRASWTSPTYSNRVYTVTITDEDFWKGPLVGRTPLKRKYLADLITRIDSVHPRVIALDVNLDLRDFNPGVSDYCPDDGADALREAIKNCKAHVVLPRSLVFEHGSAEESLLMPAEPREYLVQPSMFRVEDFPSGRVSEGYVSLPYDIRQVPLVVKIQNERPMDSFAAAIARVWDSRCVELARGNEKDGLPYGTFIASEGFTDLSAGKVLMQETDLAKLAGNVVLIGGTWHQQGYQEGRQVDLHPTPVGEIGGVVVHANYVEALLSHLTIKPLGKTRSLIIEILLSYLIAVIFAWDMSPLRQAVSAGLVFLSLFTMSLFAWQNLGLFFDFSIPLILLGGHTIFEKVREWRADSQMYRELLKEGKVQHA